MFAFVAAVAGPVVLPDFFAGALSRHATTRLRESAGCLRRGSVAEQPVAVEHRRARSCRRRFRTCRSALAGRTSRPRCRQRVAAQDRRRPSSPTRACRRCRATGRRSCLRRRGRSCCRCTSSTSKASPSCRRTTAASRRRRRRSERFARPTPPASRRPGPAAAVARRRSRSCSTLRQARLWLTPSLARPRHCGQFSARGELRPTEDREARDRHRQAKCRSPVRSSKIVSLVAARGQPPSRTVQAASRDGEHVVEHRLGQPAGESVLLAGMIRAEQQRDRLRVRLRRHG